MGNKKKFEIKFYYSPEEKRYRKDIFIDGKLFEYEVDRESLNKARQLGSEYRLVVQKDIEKHFLESLSDFLGRTVTSQEIREAHKTGLI